MFPVPQTPLMIDFQFLSLRHLSLPRSRSRRSHADEAGPSTLGVSLPGIAGARFGASSVGGSFGGHKCEHCPGTMRFTATASRSGRQRCRLTCGYCGHTQSVRKAK